MKNKILFLFGSGISKKAGLPTGEQLTENLLHKTEFFKYPLGIYNWNEVMDFQNKQKISEQMFEGMKILNSFLYINEKKPNYEDIFYFSLLLSSFKMNVKHHNLFDYIDEKMTKILVSNSETIGFVKRIDLYMNLCNFIQEFVWRKLSKFGNISYLKLIVEAYLDSQINEVSIFTLNHDLVIEKLMGEKKIDYIDGFDKKNDNPQSDARYWNPILFENECKVKLFKLHGSLNWFDFENEKDPTKPNRLGISNINDIYYTKDENGNFQWPAGGKPVFLTGTKNKIFDYENNKYIKKLINQFKSRITTINTLVISGYGFGDDGINMILQDWLDNSKNRRIININKSNPDVCFENRISTIGKYIHDTDYYEIKKLLRIYDKRSKSN